MKKGWIIFILLILLVAVFIYFLLLKPSSEISPENVIVGEPITSFFNVSENTCPENCILENGIYFPLINVYTISIEPGTLDKKEQFLADIIIDQPGLTYTDWKNYAPMVNKVNELIQNSSSELDKAKKILFWLKNSKTFCNLDSNTPENCISRANFNDVGNVEYSYDEIFDYPYGVCLDAVILGVGMLRTAGIPSSNVMVGAQHILIVFFADNKWYTADATFRATEAYFEPAIIDLKSYSRIFSYMDYEKLERDNPRYSGYPVRYSFDYVSNDYAEIFLPNGDWFKGEKNQYICLFSILKFENGRYNPEPKGERKFILNADDSYYLEKNIGNEVLEFTAGYNYYKVASDYLYKYECSKWNKGKYKPISTNYIKPLENHRVILKSEDLVKSRWASSKDFNELLNQLFIGEINNSPRYMEKTLNLIE